MIEKGFRLYFFPARDVVFKQDCFFISFTTVNQRGDTFFAPLGMPIFSKASVFRVFISIFFV